MLGGMLSIESRSSVGLGGLMRNGTDLSGLMRDGTGLCGRMNCGSVLSMMVKDRQEQTPFQVIDVGRKVESATGNSTTGFFDGVHGRHGPSWANQTVNSHALSVIRPRRHGRVASIWPAVRPCCTTRRH